MSLHTRNRRLGRIYAAAIGAVGLCTLAVPLSTAQAQVPYLGVDLGNGVGIGIGAPPSAYRITPVSPLGPYYVAPAPYYYPW